MQRRYVHRNVAHMVLPIHTVPRSGETGKGVYMPKLPQGVRRRKNGGLEKRITINGKRYSIYAGSTKELSEKEERLREEIKSGLYVPNKDITLEKYYDEWISGRSGTMKESSEQAFNSSFNTHFRNTIGKRKIRDIERREIIAVQKEIASHSKPNTVNDRMTLLKSIFSAAVIDGIIAKNPCDGVRRIKADDEKPASETIHRSLTEDEMEVFLEELKGEWLHSFFLFSFSTGMRVMEIAALKWEDIDYTKNCIHITKSLSKIGNEYIETSPKTKTSKRDIPLTAPIMAALAEQKKNNMMLFGGSQLAPDARIYVSSRGNIISSAAALNSILGTLRRLEKKNIHIERFAHHACRDTFATMFLRGGGNLQTLKVLLGHSSLAMTADLYAHVLEDTKQDEMNRVSEIFTRVAGA